MIKKIFSILLPLLSIFTKRFIFVFLFSSGMLLYNVADKTLDDIWAETGIKEKQIKSEYLSTIFIEHKRSWLRDRGYGESNILQKILYAWQKHVHDKAIKKVGPDSIERIWFDAQLYLSPYVYSKDLGDVSNLAEISEQILDRIVAYVEKPHQSSSLIPVTATYAAKYFLSREVNKANLDRIYEKIQKIYQPLIGHQAPKCAANKLCFPSFILGKTNLIIQGRKLTLLRKNLSQNTNFCSNSEVLIYMKEFNKIIKYYNDYHKNFVNEEKRKEYLKTTIYSFSDGYKKNRYDIKEQCNVDLVDMKY